VSHDERDPYRLLGVHRQASASDINRAYRRAARATHPDASPGDPSASDRFQAVNAAYETLRDPDRRAAYDRTHPAVSPAARRPAAQAAPPPVRLGEPKLSLGAFRLATPIGRRGRPPAHWSRPVEVRAPGGWGVARAGPEAELLELAAALSRSLRSAWFWR
jgi:curved DNA-binding protein CbpA